MLNTIVKTLAVLLLPLMLTGCRSDAYVAQKNLVYDSSYHFGTFDYYEPKDDTRKHRPAILAIHGGAWRSGHKSWGKVIAKEFCPRGYVAFSVNYRLSSEPGARRWHVRAHAGHFHPDNRGQNMELNPRPVDIEVERAAGEWYSGRGWASS